MKTSAEHIADTLTGSVGPGTALSGNTEPQERRMAGMLKNVFFFFSLAFRYPGEVVYGEIKRLLPLFESVFMTYADGFPSLPGIDDLQAEYIRLFVNNRNSVLAVPYASCHLNGGVLMGDALFELRRLLGRSGLVVDESAGELEDHLAVLLEYGAALVDKLTDALPRNESNLEDIFATLGGITWRYIQPMMSPFRTAVEVSAKLDFYAAAARALFNFMADTEEIYAHAFGESALAIMKTGAKK